MPPREPAGTAIRYDAPFHWWGPGWEPPVPLGLADLLRNGTLDIATTACIWSALARRCSLAVIGGRSGIGKTTLLTALGSFLPAGTVRLHLRGCYERFTFLRDPGVAPAQTALLINEISPHLPYYLWGPAVWETLACRQRGFTLLATAHGATLAEFVASLTGSPLRIPAAAVAGFDYVAVLAPSADAASGRRLDEVWSLKATAQGLAVDCVARSGAAGDTFPGPETARRRELLAALRDGTIEALPALDDAESRLSGPPWQRGVRATGDALP